MTSPLSPLSQSTASQSLIPFEGTAHCDVFVSYAVGAGLHPPTDILPDEGVADSVGDTALTFLTALQPARQAAGVVVRHQARSRGLTKRLELRTVEEERAQHPNWNERFQDALDDGDHERAAKVAAGFEAEVFAIARRLCLAKAGHQANLTAVQGFKGRYVHRGVYYLDCELDDGLLRFFGSADALHKAVSAEIRAMQCVWRSHVKGAATTPLATSVEYLGCRYFAVALPPITKTTVVGGPVGMHHVRAITHKCASAVQKVHDRLHLPPLYVSEDHRVRLDNYPLMCSPEMVTHFGLDGRTYILELARAMPATQPRSPNVLLGFASQSPRTDTSSTAVRVPTPPQKRKGLLALLTMNPPNRLSNWGKRMVAYRLMRPEALQRLAEVRVDAPKVVKPEAKSAMEIAATSGSLDHSLDFRASQLVPRTPASPTRPTTAPGELTPTLLVNGYDGITPLAFSGLAPSRVDELAELATQAIVRHGIDTVLKRCVSNGGALDSGSIVKELSEQGVNLRYIGDIVRGLAKSLGGAAAPESSGAVSDRASGSGRQGSFVVPKLPPLATSVSNGPASARVMPSTTRTQVQRQDPKTARSSQRARTRTQETPVATSTPQPSSDRIQLAIAALKVEGICRCFRAIVADHWRAALVPEAAVDGRDLFTRRADQSLDEVAIQSFRRKRGDQPGSASELLTELRLLDQGFSQGSGAGDLVFDSQPALSASQRNTALAEAVLSGRRRYCRDLACAEHPTNSIRTSATPAETRIREITARLLTLLAIPSEASTRFWDVALSAEVWTKYGGFGHRRDLRNVNRMDLIRRACALLHVELAIGEDSLADAIDVAGELLPAHIAAVGPRLKGFTVSAAGAVHDVRLATGHSTLQEMASDGLAELVTRLREGPPSTELLDVLREYQQRLVVRGSARAGELHILELKIKQTEARLRDARIREAWSRNGLDGIVYVPCGRCPHLINPSTKANHVCVDHPEDRLELDPRLTIERPPVPVGIGSGAVLDRCLTASSFNERFKPEFARLGCAGAPGWEPSSEDFGDNLDPTTTPHPWLQVELARPRAITAVAVSGTASGSFCRSFAVYFSDDGKQWDLFAGRYTHDNRALRCEAQRHDCSRKSRDDGSWVPVLSGDKIQRLPPGGLFGNTDKTAVVTNTFDFPIEARFVRFVPGGDDPTGATGMRIEVFAIDDHPDDPAQHTVATERVPLEHVNWHASLRERLLGAAPDDNGERPAHGPKTTRAKLVDEELQILEDIAALEADVFEDLTVPPGRAKVVRHSTDLPQLYERWSALLTRWGEERDGDVSVASSRLATYLVGEAELAASLTKTPPDESLVRELTPLLFASSRTSEVLEPLLRRLAALYPRTIEKLPSGIVRYKDCPPSLRRLFAKIARWAGRGNLILPYLAGELALTCDDSSFVGLARDLVDDLVAASHKPTEADGPAHLDDTPERRAALLVYTHHKFKQVIEAADRVAVEGRGTVPFHELEALALAPA